MLLKALKRCGRYKVGETFEQDNTRAKALLALKMAVEVKQEYQTRDLNDVPVIEKSVTSKKSKKSKKKETLNTEI